MFPRKKKKKHSEEIRHRQLDYETTLASQSHKLSLQKIKTQRFFYFAFFLQTKKERNGGIAAQL